MISDVQVLMTGLVFGEQPRWHEDRLWFSDWGTQEVIAVDPPASHREGPIFLGVLRVLDTPDALGMLAPMPLTLVDAKDKAFERTAQIYKVAGAGEQFHRK